MLEQAVGELDRDRWRLDPLAEVELGADRDVEPGLDVLGEVAEGRRGGESVKTKTATVNVTPSGTAIRVSRNRHLFAPTFLKVSFRSVIGAVAEGAHVVEDGVGGRIGELVDDVAVGEEHHPVGVGGGHRVVGDHHDGLAEVARRRGP